MFLLEKFVKRRNIPAGCFPAGVSDRYTRNNSGYRKAATQRIPKSLTLVSDWGERGKPTHM